MAGCASSTSISYVRALRDVQKHFDTSADELIREQLLAYLALKRKTYSSSSLNMQVCALKYSYREVLRRQDLVVSIPNPRRSKQIGEVLNSEEVRHLISCARSMRHRLVIELLFGLGLRASEVGRLKIGDFNAQQRTLTIARKALNVRAKSVVQAPRTERKAQLLEQLLGKPLHVCNKCGCMNTIIQLPIPVLQVARAPPDLAKLFKK